MKVYIIKDFDVNDVKKGAIKLRISNKKPTHLIPEELLTEIEVNDKCEIQVNLNCLEVNF